MGDYWKYDIKKHGDFKKYYDTDLNRNYWMLWYFGGGSINLKSVQEVAEQFAEATGVPYETVFIDEILNSRRFKHCKYISSSAPDQNPEEDSYQTTSVYGWFLD